MNCKHEWKFIINEEESNILWSLLTLTFESNYKIWGICKLCLEKRFICKCLNRYDAQEKIKTLMNL